MPALAGHDQVVVRICLCATWRRGLVRARETTKHVLSSTTNVKRNQLACTEEEAGDEQNSESLPESNFLQAEYFGHSYVPQPAKDRRPDCNQDWEEDDYDYAKWQSGLILLCLVSIIERQPVLSASSG